jgi:hypothetical protein
VQRIDVVVAGRPCGLHQPTVTNARPNSPRTRRRHEAVKPALTSASSPGKKFDVDDTHAAVAEAESVGRGGKVLIAPNQ